MSVGDVVAELRQAMEQLDQAAVVALRAEADALHAHTVLNAAATGTTHPAMRGAVTESLTAAEKSAKIARLLAAASKHLGEYANRIAPGSGGGSTDAMPSGEVVLYEAGRRGSRADALWRKHVQKAEGAEGAVKKTEDGWKLIRELQNQHKPAADSSAGTAAQPSAPAHERPSVDNPITATFMAVAALFVAGKSLFGNDSHRRTRKRGDGD
jgi:hypothetical protein